MVSRTMFSTEKRSATVCLPRAPQSFGELAIGRKGSHRLGDGSGVVFGEPAVLAVADDLRQAAHTAGQHRDSGRHCQERSGTEAFAARDIDEQCRSGKIRLQVCGEFHGNPGEAGCLLHQSGAFHRVGCRRSDHAMAAFREAAQRHAIVNDRDALGRNAAIQQNLAHVPRDCEEAGGAGVLPAAPDGGRPRAAKPAAGRSGPERPRYGNARHARGRDRRGEGPWPKRTGRAGGHPIRQTPLARTKATGAAPAA